MNLAPVKIQVVIHDIYFQSLNMQDTVVNINWSNYCTLAFYLSFINPPSECNVP